MSPSSHLEKWASGILGAVCLVLLLNLVFRESVRAGAPRPTLRTASPSEARMEAATALPALPEDQPPVRLDLWEDIQQRPLPPIARNPFEFSSHTEAFAGRGAPGGISPVSGAPGTEMPAGSPPVPLLNLKAMGIAERVAGEREALLADDEEIYIVREGQPFAKRFRVVKITATGVEIEDVFLRRIVQLPLAP